MNLIKCWKNSILYKVFQNTKEDETLPNSFYEASFILILEPDKHMVKSIQQTYKFRGKNPLLNPGKSNSEKNVRTTLFHNHV